MKEADLVEELELTPEQTRGEVTKLLRSSQAVFVATNGSHGHPNVRAMLPVKCDGAERVWFATSLESSKIIELVKDDKAAIYGCSFDTHDEFRLWGKISVLDDKESRESVWNEKLTAHFKDAEDPDMRVLRFDVISGSFSSSDRSGLFTL